MNISSKQNLVFWLERIVCFLLFLTPFTALIISNNLFFPFITGKAFFFRLLVELSFGLWLILVLFDKSYLPKRLPLLISVSFFVFIIGLADFFGVNPGFSFFSNFERSEGWLALIHIWAYVILLSSVFKTEKIWHYFLTTTIGVSVLVGIYGLLQLGGKAGITQGSIRLDATLGNSAYLGTFMFFTSFLTLYLWWKSNKSRLTAIIYGLIAFLQLLVLYYSATRGAIIGFGATIFILLILLLINKKTKIKVKKVAGALLISLALFGGTFYFARDTSFIQSSPVLKRFADISVSDKTARSRFMIWNMAWQGFEERPILGWGQDNFVNVFSKYYNPKMYDQEPWFDRTHNIFLDWLIAGGILGLISYLAIYVCSFKTLWRSIKFDFGEKAIFTGLIFGYLVQNLFVFDNVTSYILFFSTISFIGSKDYLSDSKSDIVTWPKLEKNVFWRYGLIGLVVMVTISISYFSMVKPYLASSSLLQALSFANVGDLRSSLEAYKKSIAYNVTGKIEAREQLASFAIGVLNNKDVPIENKKIVAFEAEQELKKQIENYPSSARILVFAGDLMMAMGRFDEAIKYYDQALELSPNRQHFLTNKAIAYLNKNDSEAALKLIKKSFELEENNDEGRIRYALLLFETGNKNLAEELLMKRFATLAVNHDLLLNYFVQQKSYDLVNQIWKLKLESNKADLNNWLSYAGSFLLLNQKEDALRVLREAVQFIPEANVQVEEVIEQIKLGRFKFE